MNHLVIAPIVLPAVMAALTVLSGPRLAQAIAALTTLALIALAMWGLRLTEPLPYFLGNWPAPFGIVLVMDHLAAVMLALTAGLFALIQVWGGLGRSSGLILFLMMGLNGAFLTADAFNLFVFFEVVLIASYGVMVQNGDLRAGLRLVAFNLIGSAVFLVALAVLYNVAGTLNMADLAGKLAQLPDQGLVRAASVLLLVVFGIKGALAPLHVWLPSTYSATSAAALFAVMTKVGAYAVIRFGTLIFTNAVVGSLWGDMLFWAALATIIVGALGVWAARDLAVMISYAVIGSMGAVFLARSGFSAATTTAALFLMIQSTLATALLFLLADGPRRIGSGGIYLFAALTMVGLPPLSGFLAKLMLLQSLPNAWAWGAVLGGSLITMLGFARMGSTLYWALPADGPMPRPAMTAMYGLMALILGMTIFAAPVTDYLAQVARDLHHPATYIAVQRLGQ